MVLKMTYVLTTTCVTEAPCQYAEPSGSKRNGPKLLLPPSKLVDASDSVDSGVDVSDSEVDAHGHL